MTARTIKRGVNKILQFKDMAQKGKDVTATLVCQDNLMELIISTAINIRRIYYCTDQTVPENPYSINTWKEY